MAIDIQIVNEDFTTVVSSHDSIDINDDFYHMRNIARDMNLLLIATIDDAGNTIINMRQLDILKKEIQQLRKRTDINPRILDILQQATDDVRPYGHEYIKLIGD